MNINLKLNDIALLNENIIKVKNSTIKNETVSSYMS